MGYNFIVSSVAVYASSLNRTVDIDVTIKQIGIAPFYYPLELVLDCPFPWQETQGGVESIIDEGAVRVFSFAGIPSTIDCLNQLSLSLWSTYAYNERPIKFSQGFDGKVMLTVPLPTINQTTAAKHTEAIFNRTTVANITNVPTNQTSSFTNITLTDAKNQSTLAPTPVAPPFQIIPPTTILPTSQIASPTIVVPAIPSARPTRYTAVFPPFPSISMISAVSPIPSLRPTTLPLYARPTVRFNEPELSQDYTKSTDSSSSNLVIPLSMVGLAIFLSILVAFILARRRTHRATYPSEVDLSQDASVDISEGGRKNVPLQMRMH